MTTETTKNVPKTYRQKVREIAQSMVALDLDPAVWPLKPNGRRVVTPTSHECSWDLTAIQSHAAELGYYVERGDDGEHAIDVASITAAYEKLMAKALEDEAAEWAAAQAERAEDAAAQASEDADKNQCVYVDCENNAEVFWG